MKNIIKMTVLIFCTFLFSACNGFFEKDNLPPPAELMPFPAKIKPRLLWGTETSTHSKEHLKLQPAMNDAAIITTSDKGVITAINKMTGQKFWQINTGLAITTGPGLGDGLIVVGTRQGEVVAFSAMNGQMKWRNHIAGEILAVPAVKNGVVVVKSVNGYLRAFSAETGQPRWAYQQMEPNLILRGASNPLIRHQRIIVGFANGRLAKLTLDGQLSWINTLVTPEGAFAIQRMIDIDADPIMFDHQLYAATYQGRIAAINWYTGETRWSRELSSYAGMTADESSIYVSDAAGILFALSTDAGQSIWQQSQLTARGLTAPGLISNYVVVGDQQGYLHWINKFDGHFAAREKIGASIIATPLVDGNRLYATTTDGRVVAYTLR